MNDLNPSQSVLWKCVRTSAYSRLITGFFTQSAPFADVREAIMMSPSTEDALTLCEEMIVEDD